MQKTINMRFQDLRGQEFLKQKTAKSGKEKNEPQNIKEREKGRKERGQQLRSKMKGWEVI